MMNNRRHLDDVIEWRTDLNPQTTFRVLSDQNTVNFFLKMTVYYEMIDSYPNPFQIMSYNSSQGQCCPLKKS